MSDLTVALEVLDTIDGIVDDTHPEGDGCPLCGALDELRVELETAHVVPTAQPESRTVTRETLAAWPDEVRAKFRLPSKATEHVIGEDSEAYWRGYASAVDDAERAIFAARLHSADQPTE